MSTAAEGKYFALSSILTSVCPAVLVNAFLAFSFALRSFYRGIFIVPETGR
jgi:hypothetical protein